MKTPEIIFDDAPLGATEKGWHHISSALKCFKEFQYAKIRKITSPRNQTPDHFAVGTLMHVAKAHWFLNQFRTDAAFKSSLLVAIQKAAEQNKLPVTLKAEQTALKYFEEYVAHYSMRALPRVLAAEYSLGPVPLRPEHPFYAFRTARLDDVSWYPEAGGGLCLGETKTTSGSVADCIKQYSLHGQLAMQLALWKAAPQGEAKHGPVVGVMLDVIQKGYGGQPCKFGRQLIRLTDRTLLWFSKNLERTLKAVSQLDWNSDARRNIESCTRMAGRARVPCEYQALCIHGKSASINYLFEDGKSLLTWKPDENRTRGPWE